METDKNSKASNQSENKRKRQLCNDCQSSEDSSNLTGDDSSNFAEQLGKIRIEFEAVKTENKLLRAHNGELESKLLISEHLVNSMVGGAKESQQPADGQKNKWESLALNLAILEAKENDMRKEKEELANKMPVWSDNRWGVFAHVLSPQLISNVPECGNVRTEQPVSRRMLSFVSGQQKFVYFELHLNNISGHHHRIGWVEPGFPLSHSWIGNGAGSYAINLHGKYFESDLETDGYAGGFKEGDVAGSGILLTRNGQLKLFFTKNGQLYGKPVALTSEHLLYPAVCIFGKYSFMKSNFGADLEKNPFKFDVNAHEKQLFD